MIPADASISVTLMNGIAERYSFMIVLHAGVADNGMVFWGEITAGDDGKTRRPARGRKAKVIRHPYSATAQEINDSFAAQRGIKVRGRSVVASVWLPSTVGGPLPSLGVGGSIQHGSVGGEISIVRWRIKAVTLSWMDSIRVLAEVVRNKSTIAGMAVGPDLAYWADVLRLAASIVARQKFTPDLSTYGNSCEAYWIPLTTGREQERIDALAACMPPAARALDHAKKTEPMEPPVTVLSGALASLVDGIVRARAMTDVPRGYSRRMRFDSTDDGWLHSLRTENPVTGNRQDVAMHEKSVRRWQYALNALDDPLLKMCLRLEDPQEGAADESGLYWPIRYFVQSRRDPGLMVPADEIWSKKTAIPGINGAYARGFMATMLGNAARIVAGMSAGIEKYGMAGYAVGTAEAHRFLREEAPILEQFGYGVMLPSWWAGGRAGAGLRARASVTSRMKTGRMLDMNSLVSFDWKLALGDQNITLDELRELADEKAPLVNMHGRWIETGSEEIRRTVDFVTENETATVRDAVMMKIGAGTAPEWADLEISGSSDDNRIAGMMGMLRGDDAVMDQLPQPEGFKGTLRPYQLYGYSWLSFLQGIGMGGCLADDMGLGKTVQVLALIQQYMLEGGRQPILLVCPTSVMDNWKREAARFAPGISVAIHHGADRKSGDAFAKEAAGYDMMVSSYGLVQRDIDSIGKVMWGGVVLDEAQNIKNADTRQARAVRTLDAGFRFALTGTPVENNVGDIWSIMEFLNPGLLGTRAEFKRNFFAPIQTRRDATATETLRRIVSPFMLRRLKTDRSVISDLPEKMETNTYCSLTREQASLYAAVLKDLEERISSAEGIQRKGLILAALTKLKQICNHPAHFLKDGSAIPDRSGKLSRLTEMLEEATESGDQALIFTQFVEMGEILRQHIRKTTGREVPFLHGGTSRGQREAMVEGFQDGRSGVLVVSLKAGGTGLNLTAANHVFHFDRWWNPAVEDQATDRAFRIGQERNVQVHKMVCSGTLEERIDEMIRRKKEISDEVIGTGEGWLTSLSDDDIRKVLSLSREAIQI